MSWEDYLEQIYYNPSNAGSYSGPDKFFGYVKRDGKYDISKYKIRKWLQRQEPYSLQRAIRKPQNRTRINVAGIDDQWSADLMDMVKFGSDNDGYTYVLVVIDVFSKFLWLRKLKDKKEESVTRAFESIFKTGRKPSRIRTDKGQEFRAKTLQSLFKEESIKHFYAHNEVKASISERIIKFIKTKLYRYFTYKQSYRSLINYKILLSDITKQRTGRSTWHQLTSRRLTKRQYAWGSIFQGVNKFHRLKRIKQ